MNDTQLDLPILTLQDAQDVVKGKPYPKVTQASIEGKIERVDYILHHYLTICIIEMKSGFMVSGQSAPASEKNFDAEVGKRYAYDNAFKQLWPLEGYLLREQLNAKETGK